MSGFKSNLEAGLPQTDTEKMDPDGRNKMKEERRADAPLFHVQRLLMRKMTTPSKTMTPMAIPP